MKFRVGRFQVVLEVKDDKTSPHAVERYRLKHYGDDINPFIDRIKAYREITGLGLRESKDWVEANFPKHGRG